MRWIPFVAYITLAGLDLVWLALDAQDAGMFAGVLPTIAAFLLAAPWSGVLSLVAHDLAWGLPWMFVVVNAVLLAGFAIRRADHREGVYVPAAGSRSEQPLAWTKV